MWLRMPLAANVCKYNIETGCDALFLVIIGRFDIQKSIRLTITHSTPVGSKSLYLALTHKLSLDSQQLQWISIVNIEAQLSNFALTFTTQ